MKRAGLEFEEINIEHDEAAAKYVEGVNSGNQTVPVVRFDDGTAMTNPSIKKVTDHVAKLAS